MGHGSPGGYTEADATVVQGGRDYIKLIKELGNAVCVKQVSQA